MDSMTESTAFFFCFVLSMRTHCGDKFTATGNIIEKELGK